MGVQRIKLRGAGNYHIYSRLVLGEFLLTDKKEKFLEITKKVAYFSGVEVLTYAIMDSHFHLLIKVLPVNDLTEEVVLDRYRDLYGDDEVDDLAERWDGYKKLAIPSGTMRSSRRLQIVWATSRTSRRM